ncbi:IS110 family transposase [Brevibacterium aurantiacum]|uniref:IS110 family transposase n=1 Tax=Brevibacterium aurantiacum TaxID=273384 RepID=UPI0021624DA8|nr:IS110 family transposase [Brevibacterium aurantiacum]
MKAVPVSTHETIIAGVDAHKDTHHVTILTRTGEKIADQQFNATTSGYSKLLDWVAGFGAVDKIGLESTRSYAAGLSRFLVDHEIDVREVNIPHSHTKARLGKSDAIDSEAAARKTLAGEASAVPKVSTGIIESIRELTVVRASAVKARTVAFVQLQDVAITAPASLRERLDARSGKGLARQCAKLRADGDRLDDPAQAAKLCRHGLAHRDLDTEIATLDARLDKLVTIAAPTLLSRVGISTRHAAQFVITAGENIDRLTSEAAFARLCGTAPIPVSSGKSHRRRLHRGGDRQANRALHIDTVCRLRYDERTIATWSVGRARDCRRRTSCGA